MSFLDDDPLRYEYPDVDCDDHDSDESDDNPDFGPISVDPIINPAGIEVRKIESCFQYKMPEFLRYTLQLLLRFELPCFIPDRQFIPSKLKVFAKPAVLTLLTQCSPKQSQIIRIFMPVFLSKKPGTSLARIIGHPATLNMLFKPRKLQLCTLADICWGVQHFKDSDSLYAIELDFKNFFPQIPITLNLSRFMGVFIDGIQFFQKCLTQGWNGSTIVAQAISWAIVAFTLPDDSDHLCLVLPPLDESPPPFIITKDPLSFIAIQYDNILVLTGSHGLHLRWRTRILRNCRYFNCVLKYLNESLNYFFYCGIEIVKRGSVLYRRTDSERFTEQISRAPRCSAASISAMAQIILRQGKICNAFPIGATPGVILHIVSTLGQTMSGKDKRDWAQKDVSLLPTYNLILAFFNSAVNPWFHQVRRVVPYALFLATDARPFITAWVVYDESGTVILADTRYYDELEISLAETCAVRDCWSDCVRKNLFIDHHYAITGIDNTTASRCLAKEYSGSTLLDPSQYKHFPATFSRFM